MVINKLETSLIRNYPTPFWLIVRFHPLPVHPFPIQAAIATISMKNMKFSFKKSLPTFPFSLLLDLAALIRDAVMEGKPHDQVLRRWRRVVVVLPNRARCHSHRSFDRPVRCDHHTDPSSCDVHLSLKENGIWRFPPPQDSTLLQDHQPCTWFISHYWGFRGVNGIVVLVFKRSGNYRFIHWLIVSSKSELLKYLPCRLILGSFVRLFCLLHPQFLFNCDAWGKPKHGKK